MRLTKASNTFSSYRFAAADNDLDRIMQARRKQIFCSEDSSEEPDQAFYLRKFTWPKLHSHVDPSIKKLELAAEKIKPIQEAIARLKNVDELAFSIDSGLGYLSGPDASDRVIMCADKSEVFGRKYAPSREQMLREWLDALEHNITRLSRRDQRIFQNYEKCLQLAFPHTGEYLQLVLDYMLEHPRGSLQDINQRIDEHVRKHMVDTRLLTEQESVHKVENPVDIFGPLFNKLKSSRRHLWMPEGHVEPWMRRRKLALTNVDRNRDYFELFPSDAAAIFTTGPHNPDRALLGRLLCSGSETAVIFMGVNLETVAERDLEGEAFLVGTLSPAALSPNQKLWLKEFGWVQNAFLSSLLTSVIRNKDSLSTVCTINFAKLSSSFLCRLYDDDFWNSLPNVNKLTIMVSPEWRDIFAGYDGDFQFNPVDPSSTVPAFYNLLTVLSERESIKTLALGYIGGGEHATGIFARNKHVLSAPIVNNSTETTILTFPHVKSLTFKNCWFVSAVLKDFMSRMERLELKHLKLESVSFIAAGGKFVDYPFTITGWPVGFPPQRQPIFHPMYVGFGIPQPSAYNLVPEVTIMPMVVDGNGRPCLPSNAKWHDQTPQPNTWADFINSFTPGPTVEENRAKYLAQVSRKRKRDKYLPPTDKRDKIPAIELISCGYAKLKVQDLGKTLNSMVDFVGCSNLKKRRDDLDPAMMKSDDPFLAEILPFMSTLEKMLLVNAFGMQIGWGMDRRIWWNGEDGKAEGGKGRFSGVVSEFGAPVTWEVKESSDEDSSNDDAPSGDEGPSTDDGPSDDESPSGDEDPFEGFMDSP